MSVAFDTNVLIYASDHRDEAKRSVATSLLAQNADAVLLWQVACEFIAASRKLEAQGLGPEEAWDQLGAYMRVFPLVVPSPSVLERARNIHLGDRVSFWDGVLLAACREAGVTRLYSEDLPGRVRPADVEVVNPFA
jgi:predicted nucleic acid-binding protein